MSLIDLGKIPDAPLMCAIGERNGMVAMLFPVPTKEFEMGAEQARAIAEQIARSAYIVDTGMQPDAGGKSMISENLRLRARRRARLVIRSLMEQNKGSDYIADTVVDLILQELT